MSFSEELKKADDLTKIENHKLFVEFVIRWLDELESRIVKLEGQKNV